MCAQNTSIVPRELEITLCSHAQTELFVKKDLCTHSSVLQVTTASELELEKDFKLKSTCALKDIIAHWELVSQFSAILMKMKFVWLDLSILSILRSLPETVLQDNTSVMVNVILAWQDMLVSSSLTRNTLLTWPPKEDTSAQPDTTVHKVLLIQFHVQLEDLEQPSRLNLKTNVTSAQKDNSTLLKLLILALLAEEALPIMMTTLDAFAKVISEPICSPLPNALVLLVTWSQTLLNQIKLPLLQATVSQS